MSLSKQITYHLFQAAMWRRYAMALDGTPCDHISREWVKAHLGASREACLKRARVSIGLARILNREQRNRT